MSSPAAAQITQGALRGIFDPSAPQVEHPVLQCVQIKLMDSKGGGPERYRVIFSDIQNWIQSMIATQLNYTVTDGVMKKGSIVRLTGFQPNTVKGKKILIVLGLEVLSEFGECDKIGEPVGLDAKPEEKEDAKPQPGAISSNGFYGNKPPQQQQAQQQHQQQQQQRSLPSRSTGPASTTSHTNLYPIESLSPYSHKWTIRVRCTQKSDVKTWHKNTGEGKLFSVNLLDESGEIRATGFNAECDRLYDLFQDGAVYYISSPCQVKLAKKQFSNLNNDYELTFERDTVVEKAEDQTDVPSVRYNFTSIGDLQSIEKDTLIDTIGVLKDVGEVTQITGKTSNKPFDKRELTLVDNTLHSVRLTVWGNTAQSFDAPLESVVAFKGVKVSDFGGRSLSLLASGSMSVDPDIDEAHRLKGWYEAQGRQDSYQTHASMGSMTSGGRKDEYKTIAQIREENIGMSDNAEYFTLKATIIYIKQDSPAYPACLSEGCNKKVVEVDPGQWRCEKCDKTHPKPEYRYMMSLNVSDHTGQLWLSCFDDTGRLIMGTTADQLMEMKENGEDAAVGEVFAEANCKTYVFRCRAKMDNFQDQQRVRYQVSSAGNLNFSLECAKLTEQLKQYNMDSDSLFVR